MKKWTEAEMIIIRDNAHDHIRNWRHLLPGRTVWAIRCKRRGMGFFGPQGYPKDLKRTKQNRRPLPPTKADELRLGAVALDTALDYSELSVDEISVLTRIPLSRMWQVLDNGVALLAGDEKARLRAVLLGGGV